MDKCTRCEGSGLVEDVEFTKTYKVVALVTCPDCHGLGRVGE